MIGKLLPVILIMIGVGAGIGAGLVLKPDGVEHATNNPCGDVDTSKMTHVDENDDGTDDDVDEASMEYVKLNNQFVVPVVRDDKVEALVVLSLSVEVEPGQKEAIYIREPKLRDAFLQVLFDHSNMGGFRGAFTNANNMDVLRTALREVAQSIMGKTIADVLITDIARQDV